MLIPGLTLVIMYPVPKHDSYTPHAYPIVCDSRGYTESGRVTFNTFCSNFFCAFSEVSGFPTGVILFPGGELAISGETFCTVTTDRVLLLVPEEVKDATHSFQYTGRLHAQNGNSAKGDKLL